LALRFVGLLPKEKGEIMSVGELEAPPKTAVPPPKGLWGEIDIAVIVGTGEYGQGKSVFGVTIAPGAETLAYDWEGGLLTYRSIGFDHVDMAVELLKKYPNGYTPEQRYLWWREDVIARGKRGGRNGKYRVMVGDPVSEIEDGLGDHIKKNCNKFGLTANQIDKSPGLFWGVMKKLWKADLDLFRTYFETLYLTVHLRDEFRGNAPTGKREPKGKETLFELASLFLWFEREKDKQGNVAAVPAANVLKSRLAKTIFVDDELKVVPVLPPRLPIATPKAIRQYISAPPDYSKLKKDERVKEHEMSDEEKLRLQAQIAISTAEAATAELAKADRQIALATAQAARQQATTPSPDGASNYAAHKAEQSASRAAKFVPAHQVDSIRRIACELFPDEAEMRAWVQSQLAAVGKAKISELLDYEADGVESALFALKAERTQAALQEKKDEIDSNPDPYNARNDALVTSQVSEAVATTEELPFDLNGHKVIDESGPITPQQLEEIKHLVASAFDPAEVPVKLAELLTMHGVKKVSELTSNGAAGLHEELMQIVAKRQPAEEFTAPTDDQLRQLKTLAEKAGWTRDQQLAWVKSRNAANFREVSQSDVQARIEELQKSIDSFSGNVPGN